MVNVREKKQQKPLKRQFLAFQGLVDLPDWKNSSINYWNLRKRKNFSQLFLGQGTQPFFCSKVHSFETGKGLIISFFTNSFLFLESVSKYGKIKRNLVALHYT